MTTFRRSLRGSASAPASRFDALPPLSRPAGLGALRLVPALLVLAVLALPAPLPAQAPGGTGEVTGAIQDVPEGVALEGTRVVLVQFRISDEGQPKSQPVQSQTVGADGRYAFQAVPIEPRTVYQVGATVGGQVVGSQPFTFPAGERQVLLNLHYPRVVSDSSAVRIEEGLVAVEPRRGAVWVTEVLHLVNGSGDTVEGVRRPLEFILPSGAGKVEMLREVQDGTGHERLGNKLLVYGNLEPGRTTVAFRYNLPVWLGAAKLSLQYPHVVGRLSVLVPEGSLRVGAPRFNPAEPQSFDKSRFDVWAATDLPAQESVQVRFSGVPVRQEVYLIPVGGFVLLMAGVVIWFLRRRLAHPDAPASA